MTPKRPSGSPAKKSPAIKVPVRDQTSAGGVVYRRVGDHVEVVIVAVGPNNRWQLPKGLVDKNEKPEVTAVREAREEGGVTSEVVAHIETIEYWYAGLDNGIRVRFHKRVHFYLLQFVSGDTKDHDWEVNEARWVPIEDAAPQLSFDNEKRVMQRAAELISEEQAKTSA
ncbi:MAG TPA: NUDIX domain-containing protein [Gemmatimonadaceae bacterium]|nr:NUDIX domain-containing protein [Gemmatimonadaceae bacterium]